MVNKKVTSRPTIGDILPIKIIGRHMPNAPPQVYAYGLRNSVSTFKNRFNKLGGQWTELSAHAYSERLPLHND